MAVKELRLLAYFVEIVRAGSMRSAADRLSVTPPVVSAALADLERLLDTTLITRSTRSMELTGPGRELYELAAQMVAASETALQRIRTPRGELTGNLSLAMTPEIATGWFLSVLGSFRAEQPGIIVALRVMPKSSAVDQAASPYDARLWTDYADEPGEGPDVCTDLRLELVCAPSFAQRPDRSLAERLRDTGLITTDMQGKAPHLRALDGATGARELIEHEDLVSAPDLNVARDLARAGLGAALVIADTVASDLEQGLLKRVSPRHRFGYLSVRLAMRDRMPSPQALAFRDFIERRRTTAPALAEVPATREAAPQADTEQELTAGNKRKPLPDWML